MRNASYDVYYVHDDLTCFAVESAEIRSIYEIGRVVIGLPPGTMINGYRILREVGRGGMAVVYHAFQENLGRDVALKLLPGALILDPDLLARFQHEARAVASLHHPAILVIHDVGAYHEQPYLVTEFIDGGTLARYLGTPQSLATVLRLLGPIAGALDYAHGQGLLHRDVKPTNILLRRDGRPVLADFGLAVAAEAEQRLTRTGLIMGTPEYMAPEQATQPSSALTAAVDRYALAVIAYELFTGRLPFGGATPVAVVMAHMTQPPPPPRTLNPEIPLWVEAVLLHGLAKDPNQRYPSATAFVEALAAGDRLEVPPSPSAAVPRTVAVDDAVVAQMPGRPGVPRGMNATVAAQAPWAQAAPGSPSGAMQLTREVQPAPKRHGRLVAAAAFGLVAGLTAIVIGVYAVRGGGGHAAVLPSVTSTAVTTATVAATATSRPTHVHTPVPPLHPATATPSATAADTATDLPTDTPTEVPPTDTATAVPTATIEDTATDVPTGIPTQIPVPTNFLADNAGGACAYARTAANTVVRYYLAIDERRYLDAYQCLSPKWRAATPWDTFIHGYSTTVASPLVVADQLDTKVVNDVLDAVDLKNGELIATKFHFRWQIDDNGLMVHASELDKSSRPVVSIPITNPVDIIAADGQQIVSTQQAELTGGGGMDSIYVTDNGHGEQVWIYEGNRLIFAETLSDIQAVQPAISNDGFTIDWSGGSDVWHWTPNGFE